MWDFDLDLAIPAGLTGLGRVALHFSTFWQED
jgi:hypothetical protein